MITEIRKKQISALAHFISNEFSNKNVTDIESIAVSEEVNFYFDNYEDCFDGMLLYDESAFHIHINVDRGNKQNSKRGRFTFSHELGHYFLDEHRIGLKSGKLQPHPSFHNLNQKSLIEYEADYFASCLLMPSDKFRAFAGGKGKNFSLQTILNLSDEFQTSILATVLRFAEVGTHEVVAIISENNIVKWYARSHDFPKWDFKFKVGMPVPPSTVAGDFFRKIGNRYTDIQEIEHSSWFYPRWVIKSDMHEQCYYSDSYGYVISLIWFD